MAVMKVIRYKASDGKEFETKTIADIYDANLSAKEALKRLYTEELSSGAADEIEMFFEEKFGECFAIFEIYLERMNAGQEKEA